LRERLREHVAKVEAERAKSVPDEGLIAVLGARDESIRVRHRTRPKATEEHTMKAEKSKPAGTLSTTTETLLRELRDECQNVVDLIHRLEARPRSARARDEILGELSAAVLHLHVHTKGLDEFLCQVD